MMKDDEVSMVRSLVTMRRLVEAYGYSITRSGFMHCPFHQDKTPSMKIYDGNRGYYCFVCHAGGDVIDFVMRHDGLGFEAAVRHLAGMFQIQLTDGKTELSPKDKKAISDRMRQREAAEKARKDAYKRLSVLSEHIHRLECLQAEFKPLSGLWCAIQRKLELLSGRWESEFDSYGRSER